MGSDEPTWTDFEQIKETRMEDVIGVSNVINLRLTDETSLFAKDLPEQAIKILVIGLCALLIIGIAIFILRKIKQDDDLKQVRNLRGEAMEKIPLENKGGLSERQDLNVLDISSEDESQRSISLQNELRNMRYW